ncbi:MBL fold metallo-hydrolase [Wenzhouxiangella marina]|uniref:beta-lactamase n=1 Tax=Wenzhouxiangella marina TaxID=1579979 RepID=A0A0K0XV50_9GAMM|nr:MBL fold metallo-hydrolase [Wenzhouxiangella marina]AKS41558.1 metallo-beta-lactamase [Wenzhouxiangella marina]MBB6086683.1 glyoxylase-like metal-dependent hydrolase (beta-lactamase superfamily II) [Wenzhouxiangella marina]
MHPKRTLLAMTLLLASPLTFAQGMDEVEIGVVELRESVFMLTGRGGNIGLVVTEDGAFLVDDQYAPLTDRIVAAVESVTDQPIRFVLNTHWHGDHTGGNENLAERGTLVVAHDNVRERMSSEQVMEFFDRTVPASPDAALPVVTFNDAITFHLGEHTIEAFHVAHAHTDGDSIVRLPEVNVIHAGDVIFYGLYPFIDGESGGSLPGLIAAVDRIAEAVDEDTIIIPGHGPLMGQRQLGQYRDMLATVHERLRARVDAGEDLETILAADITAEYDNFWGAGFLPPERWVELLYTNMTREASAGHGHAH